MAIAEVKDVRNSVFINGSPASNGQMISYGEIIETYDISKGLEESFMSIDQNDDGYLSIEFIEKKESMSIKPHCKVVFASGGTWAGPNTVLLDSKSKYVTLYKPDSKKRIQIVTKVLGTAWVNGTKSITTGMGLSDGDIIVTEEDSWVFLIDIKNRTTLKIKENSTYIIVDRDKRGFDEIWRGKKVGWESPQGFRVYTPTNIASVKG